MNKKAILGAFFSLFVATVIIIIILVVFLVIAGIVRGVEEINNGEKVYGDVGVGSINNYMTNYGRLIMAEKKVKSGENIEEALTSVGYGDSLKTVGEDYYKNIPNSVGGGHYVH